MTPFKKTSLQRRRKEVMLFSRITRLKQISASLTSSINSSSKSTKKKEEFMRKYRLQLNLVRKSIDELLGELDNHDTQLSALIRSNKFPEPEPEEVEIQEETVLSSGRR